MFVAVFFSCILLPLLLFGVAIHIYNSGYPVTPAAFFSQSTDIVPGMAKGEVVRRMQQYSRIQDDTPNHILRIVLEPSSQRFIFRNRKYINVEYDSQDRVTRVFRSDG